MLRRLKKVVFTPVNRRKDAYSESGLTLIECLVAIVVIALTTATIAPVMVFSIATRVQNQKVEQALQLAQAEVDKVRLTVEQGGDYGDRLDELSVFESPAANVAQVAAPTNFVANNSANVTAVTDARRIDSDGDGDTDFAIQLFRTTGIEIAPEASGTASTPIVFELGARVYDARAENTLNDGGSLSVDEASLTFTSGEGQRSTRPLAVLYSQVTQGDREGALCKYWEYAGSTPTSLSCN